jgi:hypothetical protein
MDMLTILFGVAFAGILGFFVYRAFRHGGLKAAMFGARIERAAGEVTCEKQGPVSAVLKVHVLSRNSGEILVGLEYVAKSFASYDMMPIALSSSEAQKLASLLQEAARAR